MQLMLAINCAIVIWWVFLALHLRQMRVRELGRFREVEQSVVRDMGAQFDQVAVYFDIGAYEDLEKKNDSSKADIELAQKMARAGLDTPVQRGRYVLFRNASWLVFPLLGMSTYLTFPAYYATLTTVSVSFLGMAIPLFWLRARTVDRAEQIHRELPLLLDLTNLGTSAGWDVVASLEKVIDALYVEFPEHPLIREMKKGRWLTASGYTWSEALEKVSHRIGDETVMRTMLALGQAITQGGNRSRQLESIAQDTQRGYYSQIEKRLGSLPIKVVLITMVLMLAYFIILLAPAVVQMGSVLPTVLPGK